MRFGIQSLLGCVVWMTLGACSGSGPDGLARKLERAIGAGDIDAALALLDAKNVSAQQQFLFADIVNDCAEMSCQVTILPLPADFAQREAKVQAQGMAFAVKPEGLVRVSGESGDKKSHAALEVPFAQVMGVYKVIAPIYTPAKIGELRGKSTQAIEDELLSEGISAGVGQPRDKTWKAKARALAPGGEAAGAFLVARAKALVAAAKANDPDAAAKLMGQYGNIVYGDKDYDGKPRPLKARQMHLRAGALRFDQDMKVLGGYALDDVYVLSYEGRDAAGWELRGCTVGMFRDGKWFPIDSQEIPIPPA